MAENAVVRARIDARIKNEAAAVLGAMGLTVSDAFRLMMVRIAKDKALPFAPTKSPHSTLAAHRKYGRGQTLDGHDVQPPISRRVRIRYQLSGYRMLVCK